MVDLSDLQRLAASAGVTVEVVNLHMSTVTYRIDEVPEARGPGSKKIDPTSSSHFGRASGWDPKCSGAPRR